MKKNLFRPLALILASSLLALTAGCNLFAAPLAIMAQDQTRKVPAEYAQLLGKSLVVWVWADDSLRFEYPAVRLDVANHARYYINQHIKTVKIVDTARVDKFQRSDYEADAMSAVQVGKKFDTDVVLFIQVSDFVTKPPSSPNLFQGRMNTQCTLYDARGDLPTESAERKLWSGKIDVVYPDKPVGMMESSDMQVRSVLLKLFGERLSKKFYEYKEPVSGGPNR